MVSLSPMRRLLLLVLMVSGLSAQIPVMLLDGESAGPYHDWKATTPLLKRVLEETGLFDVTVVTAPVGLPALAGFHPEFSKYQVVVSNYDAAEWPEPLRTQFENYVRNGGGFVSVHAADNAFGTWKEYVRMVGMGGWRGQPGPYWFIQKGKLTSSLEPGPTGSHGNRLPFEVKAQDTEHPIMKGLPPTWIHAGDELYAQLRGPGENMHVLATAHSDPANKGTGRDEPMLMTIDYGKGRVFHTTMGHDLPALSCIGFIATFQRGTEWAATGKVTQEIPYGFPTNSVRTRADLVRAK